MARGIHLGMLLILVQAEHVCCSWATQAHASQRQNGSPYVGFSQRDSSGNTRLGSSYPQNKFRQGSSFPGSSAQRGNFDPEPVVGGSYQQQNQGLSQNGGHTQTVSQPVQSGGGGGGGYPKVRFVQAKVSNLNWPTSVSNVYVQKPETPQTSRFRLSTSIASGNSVSKYPTKKSHAVIGLRSWPPEKRTHGPYLLSTSASSQNFLTSSSQPRPRSSPAKFSAQGRSSSSSSLPSARTATLFRSNSYVPNSVQRRTSATAPARRLTSKDFDSSSYQRKPASGGSHHVSYNQNGAFSPRSMQVRTDQRFNNVNPELQNQAGVGLLWNRNTDQHGSNAGGSSDRFAPTKTHSIPERFGGFAIRRLSDPGDQKVVQKPPQHTAPLQKTASYNNPQSRGPHEKSSWINVRAGQQMKMQQ